MTHFYRFLLFSFLLSACLSKSTNLHINSTDSISQTSFSIEKYGLKTQDTTTVISANSEGINVNSRFFKNSTPLTPLPSSFTTLKVALDPGHVANDSITAILEGKFIKLKHPLRQDSLFFYEADIAYKTCIYLKDSLEQLGATVLITRQKDKTAFDMTYKQWLKSNYKQALDSKKNLDSLTFNKLIDLDTSNFIHQQIIFHHFFKYLDFEKRAEKINNFKPDLSIIVHFNVDIENRPWQTPTKKNHTMAFVPGSFLAEELSDSTAQKNFCRMHSSNAIEQSITLSENILKGIEATCKTTPVVNSSNISYLKKYSIPTRAPGVFCRNLAMTRTINGRLCFLEGFYQDNYDEALALDQTHYFDIIPDRIRELGDGVLFGLKKYLQKNQKQR